MNAVFDMAQEWRKRVGDQTPSLEALIIQLDECEAQIAASQSSITRYILMEERALRMAEIKKLSKRTGDGNDN